MTSPDTVPTWPRIEAVAREDGTGEVIVDGNAQHVAAGNLDQVRVEIIRAVTNVAISFGRPVRVSTSGPDGYWPLIVYPNGAVIADEAQPRPGRRAAMDDSAPGGADQPQAPDSQAADSQAPDSQVDQSLADQPQVAAAQASRAMPIPGHEPAATADGADGQNVEQPVPEPADTAGDLASDDHSDAAARVGDDRGERGHRLDAAVDPPIDVPPAAPLAPSDQPEPDTGSKPEAQPEPAARPQWTRDEPGAARTYPQQPGYVPPARQPPRGQQPQQLPGEQPPVQAPPAPQAPAVSGEPHSQHEPTHGATASSPWPEQAQPGGQQGPGAYEPGGQRTFGRAPSGQPPAGFGQSPSASQPPGPVSAGQPTMPPMGQPAVNQPMGQPPVNQSTARPQPARWSGQRSAGQHSAAPQRSAEATEQLPPQQRQSFLTREQIEEPASRGFRGLMGKVGIKLAPNETERSERADVAAVSQHWPGPRTIAIVNAKGGAGKTPTTILLSAVFALFGGAGVVAWDNNQTRGTLGWRTEQGQHESTLLDLLPQIQRLLGTGAQSADLAHFVHHQTRDRFDVLRSKPMVLAHMQRLEPDDVDAIHAVLGKYYRLIFIDSGNDESDPMWLRMVDHSDQLVVATSTRDDHAEAGALLLEALAERDERSAALARSSVAIVSQADPSARPADVARVAAGYQALTRATVTIPFDPAMVDGLLHYGALKPETKRAWLGAAAAVARGL